MKPVFVLSDAAEDLELGKSFYDSHEMGIGDYFVDSLLSDIESLRLFHGIHKKGLWILPNAIQPISFWNILRRNGNSRAGICGSRSAQGSFLDSFRTPVPVISITQFLKKESYLLLKLGALWANARTERRPECGGAAAGGAEQLTWRMYEFWLPHLVCAHHECVAREVTSADCVRGKFPCDSHKWNRMGGMAAGLVLRQTCL